MIGPKQAPTLIQSNELGGKSRPLIIPSNMNTSQFQILCGLLNWFIWSNIFLRTHILDSVSYPGREYLAWTPTMQVLYMYKRLHKPFVRSLISTQSTLMRPDWPVFNINVVSWYQQDVIVLFEEDTQHIRPICSWRCDTVVVSQDFTAKCIVLLSLLEVV